MRPIALAWVSLIVACVSPDDDSLETCGPNGECPTGFTCRAVDRRCIRIVSGTPDATVAGADAMMAAVDAGLTQCTKTGNRALSFQPVGAIAIGPESVPIAGEVHMRDGLLTIEKTDDHATAVGLMWDCGPAGMYHVETTRVPPREAPYNLNVELARFRLMRIVQKQEDWNLFDFPRAERFNQVFHEAQALFAEALHQLLRIGDDDQLL